jgi:hypothetical protein
MSPTGRAGKSNRRKTIVKHRIGPIFPVRVEIGRLSGRRVEPAIDQWVIPRQRA